MHICLFFVLLSLTVGNVHLDIVIKILKELIGSDWRKVARELNFTRTDIDHIVNRERDDLKEQIHLFFEDWKMKEGSDATVEMLINAIQVAKLEDILDQLQRDLPGNLILCAILTNIDSKACISV